MPKRELRYSLLAVQDLEGILEYISQTLHNPQSARNIVADILDRAESLEALPFIGSIVEGLPFDIGEYRVVIVHSYLVFYRVTDANIFVDRILYERRDFLPLLGLQKS